VDDDDALVLCHRVKAALALGVRLLQVLETGLVVASPKQLVEDTGQESVLDIEFNRGAALRGLGIHIGTGEQQIVDALGTTLQGRDLEASESILWMVPIRVDAAEQKLAESSHVAASGRAIQLPVCLRTVAHVETRDASGVRAQIKSSAMPGSSRRQVRTQDKTRACAAIRNTNDSFLLKIIFVRLNFKRVAVGTHV